MRDSSFELAAPQPFLFERCLAYMTRSPLECLYEVREQRVIRLVKPLGVSESMLVEIGCRPDGRALQVRFAQREPRDEEDLRLVAAYVRDWFDLDRDLGPWQEMAEADPLLDELAQRFCGLRLTGIPDLFEALCWAIVGQQVNLAFAYKLKGRITEAYGDAVTWEGRTFRRFPDPATVAGADLGELRGLQLTGAKAAAPELQALFARWAGWEAYATFYLWHSLY